MNEYKLLSLLKRHLKLLEQKSLQSVHSIMVIPANAGI